MFGKLPLSKENIFRYINSYDIFKKYIYNFKNIGHLFRSELRDDKNPTCSIYSKGNELIYRDFAESDKLSCFDYVMQKYNLSYYQALEMIALDFNLDLSFTKTLLNYIPTKSIIHNYTLTEQDKKPCIISVEVRAFNLNDKKYWFDKYGITSAELLKAKIYPLSGFYINGSYFHGDSNTYGYFLGYEENTNRELWKIYKPLVKKKGKWFTNANENTLMGFANLPEKGDLLVITKSLKDVIILNKADLNAVSVSAEGVIIKEEIILQLKKRFSTIIVVFDNDRAGILNANKYKELYNLPIYFLPEGVKDVSDFVEDYSLETLVEYLNSEINEISSYYTRMGILLCQK